MMATARSQTVFVVDDDQAVRESIVWLLESAGYASESFVNARSFLDSVVASEWSMQPGCVLLDLRLPDIGGLELLERDDALAQKLPVVIITGHGDVTAAVRAMKAGAVDFIEKPFDEMTLLATVQNALSQAGREQRRLEQRREYVRRMQALSPRELEVMRLVVRGWLNKQIAAELGLSPKTVEVHRAHMMEKMRAASLAELVRMSVLAEGEQHDADGTEPS